MIADIIKMSIFAPLFQGRQGQIPNQEKAFHTKSEQSFITFQRKKQPLTLCTLFTN